jgi:hypothetical protein
MHNAMKTGLIALSLFAMPALAQQHPAASGIAVSVGGKVAVAHEVTASAIVTAIDKASRTVTLRKADGQSFTVVADDEVRNFDQIRVGDEVVIEYRRALTMQVRKSNGIRERSEDSGAVRAAPGEKPGVAAAHQVRIVADVVDVNPGKKTISLKSPNGNIVELDVRNPDHFKVVKKGDQVEAVYTEALAISIVPAAKQGTRK